MKTHRLFLLSNKHSHAQSTRRLFLAWILAHYCLITIINRESAGQQNEN